MVCFSASIILALMAIFPIALAQPFIVNHNKALVVTRLDPIVNPGRIGDHVHFIVGGSSFGSLYDSSSYVNAKCTTGNIAQDKSNYWTPSLYFHSNNGTFFLVPHGGANTYYNNRFSDKDTFSNKVFPFPAGFTMLGGNPSQRGQSGPNIADSAQSWLCLEGDNAQSLNFPILNGSKCKKWRAQINMPNCWDGVHATTSDNSHVSYPIGNKEGGVCPPDFKRIPSIFYEFFYDLSAIDTASGKFVLSNNDETGVSYHGDFVNGWDQDFFTTVVEDCFGSAKGDQGCDMVHAVQSYDGSKCSSLGQIVDELIGDVSNLSSLPAGNSSPLKDIPTGALVQPGSLTSIIAPVMPTSISASSTLPGLEASTGTQVSSSQSSSRILSDKILLATNTETNSSVTKVSVAAGVATTTVKSCRKKRSELSKRRN